MRGISLSPIKGTTVSAYLFALIIFTASFLSRTAWATPIQGPGTGPRIWLQDSQTVPVTHAGTGALASGQAQALAMVSADIDEDGIADLLIGYRTPGGGVVSIQRGNLDAFAPQGNASLQAIEAGQFPSPFLPDAQPLLVPVTPDFLAVGAFTGSGHQDLVVAARGGNALYLLAGDGKGNFAAPQAVNISGGITVLAAGKLGPSQPFANLIVGVTGPKNVSSLQVFAGTEQGLHELAGYRLSASVSAIDFGDLDGDNLPDAAVLAGGQVNILHGASMQIEAVSLPLSAVAVALGSFIHDRDPRVQMALLTSDGAVHIAAHDSFDPRPFTADEVRVMRHAAVTGQPDPLAPAPTSLNEAWKIVESFAAAAPFVSGGTAPLMFRTRISSNAADDVMVLNAAAGQMVVVSHPNLPDGAATFLPGAVSVRPYAGSPVAAVSARVNIDGRPGVIALHRGQVNPAVMMPLPDPIFNVNTTADIVSPNACAAAVPGQCSLREAIIEANAALGVDTISVPAGTYTLTRTNATATTGENAASTGDLDITDGVAIVGAGSAFTIIQAGTTSTNGIDKVFSINPNFNKAFDTSLSGMTIRFGRNQTSFATDGFGGGFDWEASGTGTLSVTDVIVTDNSTADGDGGGITLTNGPGGTGKATISASTIRNNVVQESSTGGSGLGGGIFAGQHTTFTVSSTTIANNQAVQATGQGGGVFIFGPSGAGGQTQFHAVTISGNHAGTTGGGIHTGAGILIDQGSLITGNVAGSDGGGLWSSVSSETTTVSRSTIVSNSATGNGGGIRVDNSASNNFVINFSRVLNNTAAAGSALSNGTGTVNATTNWWGSNAPAGGIAVGSPAATFDPFIVLSLNAGSTIVNRNGTTTLTADFLHDNHNAQVLLANIPVLVGLPISFTNNSSIGSITGAQSTIQSSGTATATYTAVGPGIDPVHAAVDNGTATVNITVPAPPVIIKAFGAASIPLNGSTSLTFTIQNNNTTTSLTGVAFSDTLPAGLVVSTPNGLTGTCGGGTITATQGANVISLSGATLAASSSCTFSVNVTGIAAGTQNNTTGNVTATEGGTGGTASASITVLAPDLAITKAHVGSFRQGQTGATYTITVSNAGGALTTGAVNVSDTLPAGLTAVSISGTGWTCPTATSCNRSDALAPSGSYPAITLTVNVANNAAPSLVNSVTVSGGGDANAGNNTATDPTAIDQAADLTITKTHSGTISRGQTGAAYIITVSNAGPGPTVGTVTVVDTLPNVTNPPVATAISGTGWTCALATLTCTRSDALAPGASYPAITLTVDIPGTIPNNFTNTATVSGGGELNTGNNTASDPVSLGPPIIITPHAGATLTLAAGSSGGIAFDVTTSDPTMGFVGFTCAGLPVGATCNFTPGAVSTGVNQMTMTISTSGRKRAALSTFHFDTWRPASLSALLFPVLGLGIIAMSAGKRRKLAMRRLLLLAGTAGLLVLFGCGGNPNPLATPPGNYQITVTAASMTAQANTTITLTVQ